MKIKFSTIALSGILLGTMLISCKQESEENMKPNAEMENVPKEVHKSQRDVDFEKEQRDIEFQKYKLEIEIKILDNDKKIFELKEKRSEVKKEKRAKYDEKIMELEQRNNELRSRMNSYHDEGNERWKTFKDELNHDTEELIEAIKDVFKNNVKE